MLQSSVSSSGNEANCCIKIILNVFLINFHSLCWVQKDENDVQRATIFRFILAYMQDHESIFGIQREPNLFQNLERLLHDIENFHGALLCSVLIENENI